jgi:RNA polymerase sigma factor (sigma-70 family)
MRMPQQRAVMDSPPAHPDLLFARQVMAGETAAVRRLRDELGPELTSALAARAWDSRTREKAYECAADVLAECFGGFRERKETRRGSEEKVRQSLLELYNGNGSHADGRQACSLKAFLFRVALNRLINWSKSIDGARTGSIDFARDGESSAVEQIPDPGGGDAMSGFSSQQMEEESAKLLADAFHHAFEGLPPRQVVLLRLHHLHGFEQQNLARVFGLHPSGVSRDIKSAEEALQRATLAYLHRVDPYHDVTWADCLALCAKHPRTLHGDAIDGPQDSSG